MKKQFSCICGILVGAGLFLGCGSEDTGDANSRGASTASPITYRLTTAAEPWISRDGSFLGVKFPPEGTTGLRGDMGLVGTFQVLSEIPTTADLTLDYRITQVDMTTLDPRVVSGISAQGDEIGRIQLHADGSLSMTLQVPILGVTYDLSLYNPAPYQYRFENGQLLLRGVEVNTPFDEPYFGTPLIYLWADPES